MRVFFCTIVLVFLFFNNSAFAKTDKEKLKKIDDQLISIKKLYENDVLDETTYEDSKQKLLSKKSLIQKKKKKSKKKSKEGTSALEAQLKTIKKLFDDGLITPDEFLLLGSPYIFIPGIFFISFPVHAAILCTWS